MKTMKRILVLAISIVLINSLAYADDVNVDYSELPAKARAFLEKHFGKTPATKEVEQEQKGYSVELRNGYDVKFNDVGELMEIEAPDRKDISQGIITDVLPAKAVKYLKGKGLLGKIDDIKILKNGDYIVEIDKMVNDYKIRFDRNGTIREPRRDIR